MLEMARAYGIRDIFPSNFDMGALSFYGLNFCLINAQTSINSCSYVCFKTNLGAQPFVSN